MEFFDWEDQTEWKTLGKMNRGRGKHNNLVLIKLGPESCVFFVKVQKKIYLGMMPGVSFLGGTLTVIGGYSWPGPVPLIEQWDVDEEKWVKTEYKLEFPR